jgi:hypothetical protein
MLSLLINLSHCLIDIQILKHESSSTFKLDEEKEGWLLRCGVGGDWQRVCWLPYKRRKDGEVLACFGQQVVIGAFDGLLTILDFSNV